MKDILKINYEKYCLNNGMEVILYRDDSLPLISVNLWYRVGSGNEQEGKTGFAHLFEHMMFQGSKNVPKQMHFRYIQEAGGNLNGSTTLDRTNYYQSVPSNYLELVLWLESDRMGFLLPALNEEKLANQIDVVKNERRQRYENQPYGLAWEILFSNLFPKGHPYNWPTIGWMEDISDFKLEDIRNFFSMYYSPNNASLVVAGDFDRAQARELVEKYFGEIQPGAPIPEIKVPDFKIEKEISLIHKDNVQLPRLYLAWHTERSYQNTDAALEVLSDILTGTKNSRLYKTLVFDKEIAQQVSSYQYSAKLDGTFIIIVTAKPGYTLDQVKQEVLLEYPEYNK